MLGALPTCYVVDLFANRPAACTCLHDAKLTAEQIDDAAQFLMQFALLSKDQQRTLIVQWVTFSVAQKKQRFGQNLAHQTRTYVLPGTSAAICRNTVQQLVGYGARAWKSCVQLAASGVQDAAGSHGLTGKPGNRTNQELVDLMHGFFKDMEGLAGPRATRLVRDISGATELRDTNEEILELPSHMTKLGLYRRLVAQCGYELQFDGKHRIKARTAIAGMETCNYPSESSFMNYWAAEFSHLVPQRARKDVCGDCYTFSNRHKFLTSTLAGEGVQGEEGGGAGGGGSTGEGEGDSPATLTAREQERAALVRKQEKLVMDAAHHVDMARKQREHFREKKEEAYQDRLLEKPPHESVITWVADYAQNVSVPSYCGEQPGDTYYYSPLNTYVFGIADCSTKPTELTAHVCTEDSGKKGGNNVASMIYHELERKGFVPVAADFATHKPIKELNLFFDNCAGQNKNRMVFRLLLLLVKRKIARLARAIFLIRGHTKNDCDRIFNSEDQHLYPSADDGSSQQVSTCYCFGSRKFPGLGYSPR